MDTHEPIKTFNDQTVHETTTPITLHISASLYNSSTDYDLGEMEVDMPINLEPTASANGRITVIPKIDSKSFLKRLTDGANAFIEAFNA